MKKILVATICTAVLCSGCSQRPSLIGQPSVETQDLASPNGEEILASESAQVDKSVPSTSPTASPQSTERPSTRKPTAATAVPKSAVRISSLPSEFFSDETRLLSSVDTIVIHSLYNPRASDPFSIQSAKAVLDQYEVSSHFVIDRGGTIYQLVAENRQAWHAGDSTMPAPDGRTKVNAFSIGIELIGSESSGFMTAQYDALAALSIDLIDRLPINTITSHSAIAPGRKTDPWGFEWDRFQRSVGKSASRDVQFLFN